MSTPLSNNSYPVCILQAIPEGDARGFCLETPAGPRAILLARRSGRVYAYVNRCPHTGVNLDWVPDRFLDRDGLYLQCATHGALFRIHDGFCLHGPCAGQSLQPLTVCERDGTLYVSLPAEAGPGDSESC